MKKEDNRRLCKNETKETIRKKMKSFSEGEENKKMKIWRTLTKKIREVGQLLESGYKR